MERHHRFSKRIAKWIARTFDRSLPVNDLGCGLGHYCMLLQSYGFVSVTGYDGTPNIQSDTPFQPIVTIDLSLPCKIPAGQTICLGVGEHIPKKYEQTFLDNIAASTICRCVIAWGTPEANHSGIGHVNCQSNAYIIEQLSSRGFIYEDAITNEARSLRFGAQRRYFRTDLMYFTKP